MNINSLIVDGYANIERVELSLNGLNALVAFNNYGKSNLLKAIEFGLAFIKSAPTQKSALMNKTGVIPINNKIAGMPFSFEINATFPNSIGVDMDVNYYFSFEWKRNTQNPRIISERLRVKQAGSVRAKYTQYINRTEDKAFYHVNPKGRCDKSIVIDADNLVINKIANLDELFYLDIIKRVLTIDILSINTMQDPELYFNTVSDQSIRAEYSLDMTRNIDPPFFIYSLMKMAPDSYELLKSAILSLLPTIEDVEPIEIDLKELSLSNDNSAPFSRPEKFYDIRVKERYNNQQTSIRSISAGSKKIIYTLAMAIGADINRVPLIMFEELENSIHPALFQSLLMTFDAICPNTKIILTSHSPYLIKYLSAEKIKIGVPNSEGLAMFKEIKPSKEKRILALASEEGVTLGDYIFSVMYDAQQGDVELLNDFLRLNTTENQL